MVSFLVGLDKTERNKFFEFLDNLESNLNNFIINYNYVFLSNKY